MMVSDQVVSGARKVMYFGFLRRILSAKRIITLRPPAVCSTEAQPITARMVKSTSTGGFPGARPKTNAKMARPRPPIRPRPYPP